MEFILPSVMLLLSSLAQATHPSEKLEAVVSIKPNQHVSRGESVTLRCEIVGGRDREWTYVWYKNTLPTIVSTGQEYHLGSVNLSHTGAYLCNGQKITGNKSVLSSAAVLTVSGASPPASLILKPSRTQHFSGDSLSLSCEGQNGFTGGKVRQYTNSKGLSSCSSDLGSVTGSTCIINSTRTEHTGLYWCQSESGESSSAVHVTVYNGNVILDSPVHPLTEGDSLHLRCLVRNKNSSNVTAALYKDGLLLQDQTTGEKIIPTVSKSDEGVYHCKYTERFSPKSWISVRASVFPPAIAVGMGLTLALCIVLILLWYYRAHKGIGSLPPSTGNGQNGNQTTDQTHMQLGAEMCLPAHPSQAGSGNIDSAVEQADNSETGGAAAEPSDVTYCQVVTKKLSPLNKDPGPEAGDVIYADVKLEPKKNEKRTQEKASGSAQFGYTEL